MPRFCRMAPVDRYGSQTKKQKHRASSCVCQPEGTGPYIIYMFVSNVFRVASYTCLQIQ